MMSTTKKSLKQVVQFAFDRMREKLGDQAPDWGSVHSNDSSASLVLTRTFQVQVAIVLDFRIHTEKKLWIPVVRVNAPALNLPVTQSMAFFALYQEAVLFAATLQTMLDEFEAPFDAMT